MNMRPWAPSTRAADMGSVPTCRPVLVPGPACMTCTHRPPQASWWASTPPHRPDPKGLCFCVPAPSCAHTRLLCVCRTHSRQGGPGPGLGVSHELLPQHPQHMAARASNPRPVTRASNASVTITSKSSTGFGDPRSWFNSPDKPLVPAPSRYPRRSLQVCRYRCEATHSGRSFLSAESLTHPLPSHTC